MPCAAPHTVANLASPDAVDTMALSGGDVYWVNEHAATVESAPAAGGSVSTVCSLTPNTPGTLIASTIAVVDGYAYVAGAWGGSFAAGLQRCSLEGGASTLYFAATGAINVATDGDYLYWISGQTGDIEACLPGLTCGADTTLPAPGNVGGFALFGGYAYWTTLAVGRVPLPSGVP